MVAKSDPQRRSHWPRTAIACAASALAAFALGRWSAVTSATPGLAHELPRRDQRSQSAASPGSAATSESVKPWQQRWNDGAKHADLPTTEADRIALLRELAASDPEAAMQLAESEPNWRRRGLFVRAALHGWATREPQRAVEWMLAHLRVGERHDAAAEIAAGAVEHPVEAAQAIAFLCRTDTGMAGDYGALLITELGRVGAFDRALEFAATATVENRNHWIGTAFFQWAQHQPQEATAAVAKIEDVAARSEAWQSAVSGWAESDPASLVAFAEHLPEGTDRQVALHNGLLQWVTADPISAVKWMERMEPGEVFDDGAAAVATLTDLVTKNPDVAIAWARSIKDPLRRSSTLADVMRQWASRDAEAARRYIDTAPDLAPGDRISLLEDIKPPPSE